MVNHKKLFLAHCKSITNFHDFNNGNSWTWLPVTYWLEEKT